ncbi:D-alanyl-D-alanine carboxypeptidase family protein [Halopseudomonas pachastrellae]|nr:D-alanyl-D-alanine carboxypeptidase family protein [Halopseudomonas pachastrellae]
MLKKLISTLLISSAVVLTGAAHAQSPATPTLNAPSAAAPIVPSAPDLAATSYLLIDANSGAVLVENNADNPLPPASLTKMMTSYIVSQEIKRGRSARTIRCWSAKRPGVWAAPRCSFVWVTRVPVIDLLRGVIIQSGNDASIALAEHVAGSEDAFADLMNAQAQRLGMTNSHFVNATGWPAEDHYASARDLATLAQAIIRDDPKSHYAIYGEKEFVWNEIRQPNRNLMLWRDSTVDGLKTGHTEEAGYCLVASAKRDDMRLISVVMGTTSEAARAAETQKLLTWGFRFFETKTFYQPGQVLAEESVWKGAQDKVELGLQDGLMLTLPKGQADKLEAGITLNKPILAPIQVGDVLGEVEVKLGDEVVHKAPLVALSAVEEAGLLGRLWDSIRLFFYGLFD